MQIKTIVAMDTKNGIGKDNKLLWHIPKDLAWFKEKTSGGTIVMGRKCYEDIITYTKGKPLPGRKNIILTNSTINNLHNEFIVYNNIEKLLEKEANTKEIFIIGGGQIYKSFIDITDELIITHVHKEFNADVFFPQIDYSKYVKTYNKEDSENGLNFNFSIYKKITP